jgi:hypothetical protein
MVRIPAQRDPWPTTHSCKAHPCAPGHIQGLAGESSAPTYAGENGDDFRQTKPAALVAPGTIAPFSTPPFIFLYARSRRGLSKVVAAKQTEESASTAVGPSPTCTPTNGWKRHIKRLLDGALPALTCRSWSAVVRIYRGATPLSSGDNGGPKHNDDGSAPSRGARTRKTVNCDSASTLTGEGPSISSSRTAHRSATYGDE